MSVNLRPERARARSAALAFRAGCGLIVAALSACGGYAAEANTRTENETHVDGAGSAEHAAALIYGADTRVEPRDLAASDPLRRRAELSAAALFPAGALVADGSTYRVTGPTLGEVQNLCPGERFADQPASADCGAVLIAQNEVLTAGHCVTAETCPELRIAFDYHWTGSPIALPAASVFRCHAVRARRVVWGGPNPVDYAILTLDRNAEGFEPVSLAALPEAVGAPVALIGTPGGLPIKIDPAGRITAWVGDPPRGFRARLDAFAGASGSGVFALDGALLGILVRGESDYVSAGGCRSVRVLPETEGREWVLRPPAEAGPAAEEPAAAAPPVPDTSASCASFAGGEILLVLGRRRRPRR